MAWLVRLSQSQTLFPSRRRSASPSCAGTAILTRVGPSYQTWKVCVPDSSDSPDSGSSEPGRSGRPSDAVSWAVAVRADGQAAGLSTAASSWAVVRAGSLGVAWAPPITDAAMTIPTAATAPAGTAHLARRRRTRFAAEGMFTGTSGGYRSPSRIRRAATTGPRAAARSPRPR